MIVMRRVKIEVNRPKIGDRIRVGHYTATCQEITPKGALFLLDQYLDKAFPMNWNDTNKGGYPESDLRKALQSDEVLNIFADIRDYMVPFDNGDLLRIPFAGEMFGDEVPQWIESDSNEQWPLMTDAHNRTASRCGDPEWGWLANTSRDTSPAFCSVTAYGAANGWLASALFGVRPVFVMKKRVEGDHNGD
ncbi:MAG: hypothetical protein SPL63_08270 [Roseburia faecis]|nr:hypothetical protein [Roseburia faecis]MDY6286617.1 hypothetical protein [Lachnospiraceae bacterium]